MAKLEEAFIRNSYPGLNEGEDELVRKYLRRENVDPVSLETNISLGPGEVKPDFVRDEFRKAWQSVSQLKLDLLVETSSEFFLVELKDHIRTSALGQVLAYRFWLDIQRNLDKPVVLQAASEVVNPSAVLPYRFHNVEIVPLSDRAEELVEQGDIATTGEIDFQIQ